MVGIRAESASEVLTRDAPAGFTPRPSKASFRPRFEVVENLEVLEVLEVLGDILASLESQ